MNFKVLDIREYVLYFEYKADNKLIVFGSDIDVSHKLKYNAVVCTVTRMIDIFEMLSRKIINWIISKSL